MSHSGHSEDETAKEPPIRTDKADFDRTSRPRGDGHEDGIVVEFNSRPHKPNKESSPSTSYAVQEMTDTPSRLEIAAQLQAAEARTEARIAQLSGAMEVRFGITDHKIDMVVSKIDQLVDNIKEMKEDSKETIKEVKEDSKETRRAIWQVGIGAVLAVLALIVGLWVAGINIQGNMIATFQAALGVRGVLVPTNPPIAPAPTPAPPAGK